METVVADARRLALGRRFSLVLVPMQTLQLLGGPRGRAAFLRRALDHLVPGGLLAAAVADAMDCFDEEHPMPPPPAARDIDGVRYASQLLSVVDDGGCAAIHRLREVIGPGQRYASRDVTVRLDRVSADELAAEAARLGFLDRAPPVRTRDRGVPRLDGDHPPRAWCGTFAAMALLSSMFRTAAITGRTDTIHAWFADRQGGRWAEQTVRAALPHVQANPPPDRDPAEALRQLTDLRRSGVVTDAEFDALRARLGV